MKQVKSVHRWGVFLLASLMCLTCLTMTGCKKGDKEADDGTLEEVPTEYEVGDESVLALMSLDDIAVQKTVSEDETAVTYTYAGLPDTPALCAAYAQDLTEHEDPFVYVDDALVKTDAPDLTGDEGSVHMARAAAESGKVCVLQMHWTEDSCVITVDVEDGAVTQPVTASANVSSEPLTLATAVSYLEEMSPAELGLEGTSMSEYQIYSLNGAVFVDGNPCLHLKVYSSDNKPKTNEVSGDFLLTGDKQHLYSLDVVNGTVEEIV
jgi:hypothetical protein